MYDIPFISMITIDRELPIIDVGRRHLRWRIRRDGERRRNTDAQTDDRSTANVDKKSQIRERRRVDDRIGIWFEDTDKFECCHWFKWMILYFISLDFISLSFYCL